ncbi:MAG: metallophosphoesterase [Candidatus Zixiibacteriota bacterium]|nr:MAG: metallophosphoesterase [candidate division Zixibacteria bacterium]
MKGFIAKTLTILLVTLFTASRVTSADSTEVPLDLNDGPYVFWQNDSTAIVFYICNDTLVKYALSIGDTLRFEGFCRDSLESYTIVPPNHNIEAHTFDNVFRIFAVSDIHGEYEHIVDLLLNAGIIDGNSNWAWGDGHLVIVGDVVDRGDKVTECLWLIYKLEQQAPSTGGRVHFLLGNHELMVLQGDNRYIHERYMKGIVRKTRIKHEDLYGPDMELGRWLRSKHVAVKINDILFTHAGIPPFVTEVAWDLGKLNGIARLKLDLRSSQIAFDDTAKLLFGSGGPFWYRGYHYGMEGKYEQAGPETINRILAALGATTIVVGHTECPGVHWIEGNRILAIDIPVEDVGSLQGVLFQGGEFWLVDGSGKLKSIE